MSDTIEAIKNYSIADWCTYSEIDNIGNTDGMERTVIPSASNGRYVKIINFLDINGVGYESRIYHKKS